METNSDALAGLHELRLCFDGCQRRHIRIAALVHALDIWDQVELTDVSASGSHQPQAELLTADQAIVPLPPRQPRPSKDNDTGVQLITETGEVLTGYALFQKLTRTLRLLWPLALITWIPARRQDDKMTR